MPSKEIIVDNIHSQAITGNHIHSTGSVQVDGTLNVDDKATSTKGLQITFVTHTPAETVTLSAATHGNRLNLIPSTATANDSYVLPTASVVGEWYQFIWSGVAADTDNIIFRASAASGLTFSGGVISIAEDHNSTAGGANYVYPGGSHEKLTLTNPTGFNITFTAITTTKYCVSGWTSSTDTATAFGDHS